VSQTERLGEESRMFAHSVMVGMSMSAGYVVGDRDRVLAPVHG
jgi:hypothetical protein